VVFITRVAGMRVYVVGRENIPPGVCLFAANHTSNADAPAIIGAYSAAPPLSLPGNRYLIFPSALGVPV